VPSGKKIAIAGCGELAQQIIKLLQQDHEVTKVILGKRMSPGQIQGMITFCDQEKIPYIYGFTEAGECDLIFTPNFTDLIKADVLERYHCINVHYALLPRFRGIHPVQAALLNDDQYAGYTLHKVDEGIDSGPIYFQYKAEIQESDTIHSIVKRNTDHFLLNIREYINEILEGRQAIPQEEEKVAYCGRRKSEDGLIDWKLASRLIYNQARALLPPYYPGAFTWLGENKITITACEAASMEPYYHICGQILDVRPGKGVLVKTGDTALWIKTIILNDKEEGPAEVLIGRKVGRRFQDNSIPKSE
jgi:methionyl-tRNA formyltransferase